MNSECLLINTPKVDFRTFMDACQRVFDYAPIRAADATARTMTDAERFLSCLAAFRDRKAPAGFAANLLSHTP